MQERLQKIRLLLLDVDGVMTDGRIVYDDRGGETKAFDVRDGHGLKLLQRKRGFLGMLSGWLMLKMKTSRWNEPGSWNF